MPDFSWSFFLMGCAAGLLPDALRFAKNRHEGFPAWFRKAGYWAGLVVLIVLGGLASWLGGAEDWQSAIAMGFAAPEVISKLVSTEGQGGVQVRDESAPFNVRAWWAR